LPADPAALASPDPSGCRGVPAELTEEVAQRFDLATVEQTVSGVFDAPLVWTFTSAFASVDPSDAFLPSTKDVSGYAPRTRIRGDVTLGAPQYYQGEPTGDAATGSCGTWVLLPAMLRFATTDGALGTLAQGVVRLDGTSGPTVFAVADLSDVQGKLDLHLDTPYPYLGALMLKLNAFPTGRRGYLDLQVTTFPDAASLAAYDPLSDAPTGEAYPLIDGLFPGDRCDSDSYPAASDVGQRAFGDRSPLDVLSDWRSTLDNAPMAEGRWRDGGDAGLRVDLADPNSVCVYPYGSWGWSPVANFTFQSTSRLTSTDGRIDSTLTHGVASDTVLRVWNVDPSQSAPLLPVDRFASEAGINGVDVRDNTWLSADIDASYSRDGSGLAASGVVEISGDECSLHIPRPADCPYFSQECLFWPASAEVPLPCQ